MSNHTPGPWKVTEHNHKRFVEAQSRSSIALLFGDDKPTLQADANAQLIAAAPELLAACKRMIWAYEQNLDAVMSAAIDQAYEAIHKAGDGECTYLDRS